MKGYYSLVQFCPDAGKAESANVGLVLLCPDLSFIDCLVTEGNDRPRRFFQVHGEALARLDDAKRAFEQRIKLQTKELYRLETFSRFIATRANDLRLTEPRAVRVEDPAEDLRRLFKELVGGRSHGEKIERAGRGISLKPRLREIFSRPELGHKIAEDFRVDSAFGIRFKVPYAFRNGVYSLVAPQTIHIDQELTMKEAGLLAFRGRHLDTHGIGHVEAKLIVPLPRSEEFASIIRDIDSLLRENKVRTVFPDDLEDLAEEALAAHDRH